MSVKNFRFVSPGVFVDEIDNSQIPAQPVGIGPVIIGRAEKGPGLVPVRINSFSEFVQVFGTPGPGAAGDDVWRQGNNKSATTYGAYAAQAYLRNSSPLTYIRLMGAQSTANGGPTAGSAGEAGWSATKAWGLFMFESGSRNNLTGALAAIIYTTGETTLPVLSGSLVSGGVAGASDVSIGTAAVTGSNVLVADTGTNYEFKLIIPNYSASVALTATVNLSEQSPRYIRKVLNTNPQLSNAAIAPSSVTKYWLGESFDRHIKDNITTGRTMAALCEIYTTGSSTSGSNYVAPVQAAQTPWIKSCDLGSGRVNLFKVHALNNPGDWTNRNIKISIQDVKQSTNESSDYGTFSLVIRSLSDSDNVVRVIEQFDNCDLNPNSLNYVARKVGDRYLSWNETERRYVQAGDYDNRSDFIRVEVTTDVEAGITNASYLPFGFDGIVQYDNPIFKTEIRATNWMTGSQFDVHAPIYALGTAVQHGVISMGGNASQFVQVLFPAPQLRVSASDGNLSTPTDAYFGMQVGKGAGSTTFDRSTIDLLKARGGMVGDMFSGFSSLVRGLSTEFTLDDISGSQGVWVSGSSAGGTSLTAVNGAVSGVLDAGYDRFTVPVYGGVDGTDITEMDPFANYKMSSTATDLTSYEFNSIRRAMDSVADPEVVEMNLATYPGLTHEGLTSNLVRLCEDRADALAVIDLANNFSPREEGTEVTRNNNSNTIRTLVSDMRSRALNSSYGCAFYPWVRARDTINGALLWLPPSVAAIGTFSSSQRKTYVWFAPAGFNRGGLTEGSAGIPVIDVAHQLRRIDRDDLYSANINPIAKFPAEGIVIFGQKTLQVTPSALDRINVRRLMIFIKKRISQIATRILFDPNVPTTWARFKSQAVPFLEDVQTNFGLSEFKLILDGTTTTPDLIDRNILYAKIFLKPTRAIEFIAIDFNITRTGASFND